MTSIDLMITLKFIGFILATVIDLFTGFTLLYIMDGKHKLYYGGYHRFAKWVLAFGLLAQSGRNLQFLLTSYSPSDAELPLWFLKDFGVFLVVVYWWFKADKEKVI
jgi:hypothetical protein